MYTIAGGACTLECIHGVRGEEGAYRVWWGNLRERDHLEDPGIVGRIIL